MGFSEMLATPPQERVMENIQ